MATSRDNGSTAANRGAAAVKRETTAVKMAATSKGTIPTAERDDFARRGDTTAGWGTNIEVRKGATASRGNTATAGKNEATAGGTTTR